jgi:hypothetical protein
MISVLRWLRRRWWAIEDAVTDLIDWSPRPAPSKPLPPAPSEEPKHHVPFHFAAVGMQRADTQSVDALFQQQLFKQIASRRYFEIGY